VRIHDVGALAESPELNSREIHGADNE
jgi:hypothetical protein